MGLSTPARLARVTALLAVALWLLAAAAFSQENAATQPAASPPEIRAIPLEEVQDAAEALTAELDSLLPGDALNQSLETISEEIEGLKENAASLSEITRSTLAAAPGVARLQELALQLTRLQQSLQKPDAALDAHLTDLRESLDRLDTLAPVWKETEEQARRAAASPSLLRRIASTRREIDRARGELVARRNDVLTLRDQLTNPLASLEGALKEVRDAIQGNLTNLLAPAHPPIWDLDVRAAVLEELRQSWAQHLDERLRRAADYARQQAHVLAFQLALFAALALGLRRLRVRAKARAEESYDLREAERVFALPTAMALVLAFAFTPELHPLAPPLFTRLVSILLAVALALIVRRLAPPAMNALVMALPVFFVVDQVRYLIETGPAIARVLFLLELLFALGFLLWLLRPSRLARTSPEMRSRPFFRVVGVALRLAIVLLALAIAAEGIGLANLSDVLGNGILRCTYAALLIYGVLKVAQSLLAYSLVLRPLRLLHMVSRHRVRVRRHLDRALGVLAAATWAYAALLVFGVAGSLSAFLTSLLGGDLTVGAISISLGDLLVFALVVWLSFALARFLNFVLEEDVFPRMPMARGVPYAVSSLARYTLIFLGFLVALAAAGIELGNLTVIVGGLGVGIGFGLQNVVNNFVSGLILLFERPVQVGDAVQLASQNLWGEIRRIGIRASVIHTFDGAEVVVPNGQLISEAVTNWTLSDRHRRVEVKVGVEYGTDAQRVIDLLLEVAQDHPSVLEIPAPRAFFLEFGDSALLFLLRGWIPDFNDGFAVRSALNVAVQRALADANIGVPFPQRDLHLRTLGPTAAKGQDVTDPLATGRPSRTPASSSPDPG